MRICTNINIFFLFSLIVSYRETLRVETCTIAFIITFSVCSDEPGCKWVKLEDVALHRDADGFFELQTDQICNDKFYYKQRKPNLGHYLYYLPSRWVGGDFVCEEENEVFLWGAGDVISPDLVPKNTWKEKLDAASKEFLLDINITVSCTGQYLNVST